MKSKNNKQVQKFLKLRHQQGASLLEGIAYLGIAALIVLGAVSLLNNASASAKANQTQAELTGLRTAIKKLYGGQGYPAATLVPVLTGANAVPTTLTVTNAGLGTATILNSWGGSVSVGSTTTTFTITYEDVPKDVCVNALSGMSGWTSIKGTGAIVTLNGAPMPPASAAAQCGNASNDIELIAS